MGQLIELLTNNHVKTKRDYHARSVEEKPIYAALAKKFDYNYWDGSREIGYGGYTDDGRWHVVAQKLLELYNPPQKASILDIGCGKGFLLKELILQRPDLVIKGLDISSYAIEHSPSIIKPFLELGKAEKLDLKKDSWDLIISLNTLHNLELPDLVTALKSIELANNGASYICVESYRNEHEKWNLMRWQLTCEAFYTPKEWKWIFSLANYSGDYEFIFFE
jgi:SAM-dependent methyltransferase